MQTKLTLSIDDAVVERAKRSAKRVGKSVSQMVEEYFTLLDKIQHEKEEGELPPIVKHLKGLLKGSDVKEEDYYEYLDRKHR